MRRRTRAGSVATFAPATSASPEVGAHARGEDADRRRLPRAVRTEQAEELAVATARSSESIATMPPAGGAGGAGTPRRFLIAGAG